MHIITRIAAGCIALAGAAGLSCAGPDESPTWSLTKAQYDPYGNAALLSPANDTRVNLLLLLAAGQGQPGPDLGTRTFFAWYDLTEAVDPQPAEETFAEPSRCQSVEGGTRDFIAALTASKASAAEKATLTEARKAIEATCGGDSDGGPTFAATVSSGVAKAYLGYLLAAESFYQGNFAAAETGFAAIAKAPDPWLREAVAYMTARTALNAAQAKAVDEYGSLTDLADRSVVAPAEQGFQAYLKAYPRGRYAASARGLMRRVHWLGGDQPALAADYATVLAQPANPPAALELAEEIDYKLTTAQATANAAGPLLLAVSDLQRMRPPPEYDAECCKPVTAAEIAAQAPAFAGQDALYAYVRAAYAFHVAKSPKEVLALIPDDARRAKPDALAFSRQMLRGLALDASGDRNARGFWLELIGSAKAPGQRRAIELALARHDEATGGLDRVFASGSPVTDPIARAILLQRTAAPALLRQQVKAGISEHERQTALWILLAKELTRGFYADFVRDLALLPGDAQGSGIAGEADGYTLPKDFLDAGVPLGAFAKPATGEFSCPALRQTAATLAKDPLQPAARLCLGDFLLQTGFDWYPFDTQIEQGLGSSRSLFPGSPVVRQAIYTGVIADPRARPEDKAYALYRAVWCYGPSGYNSCGGADADPVTRKGWFQRLKRDYPQTRWARELKYYW